MAFDFSSLFSPERMLQGQQGVQAVNRMPWVFNGYGPQGQMPTTQPTATAAPVTAPPAATPLQQLLGVLGIPFDQMTQSDQLNLLHPDAGG